MEQRFKVQVQEIVKEFPSDLLDFKDTSQLKPLDTIIGQARAIQAIDFGLNMKGFEYNVFVTGLEGTGKATIVRKLVEEHALDHETPEDLCLVNNFDDDYHPVVIKMPPGSAFYFSKSMTQVVQVLKTKMADLVETPLFNQQQNTIWKKTQARQNELFDQVELFAKARGISIVRDDDDYQVVPLHEGQPMSREAFDALDEKLRSDIDGRISEVEEKLQEVFVAIDTLGQETAVVLKELVSSKTEELIAEQLDPVRYYFKDCADIQTYLKNVKADILENFSSFLDWQGEQEVEQERFLEMTRELLKKYQVNVLVDRRQEKGAPVVFEPNPTFHNLFGKIEKRPVLGSFKADFTMVVAGSLLKANGGHLIINIEPLLANPVVWETFKGILQESMLRIEDMPGQAECGMPSLKPAPIPLYVKVILIGEYEPFRHLQAEDSRFNKIFKVRADFDYEAEKTDENLYNYARFIALACKQEGLADFTARGVMTVIEYGSRMVAHRQKLSLRFGQILGVLKEADYWARKEGSPLVDAEHMTKALYQQRFRHNLYEEKVMAQFEDHTVLLDVKDRVTGQVNALAVYDMGEIAFGRPVRITAESYMGEPGIINIDRESFLSGETHDKGVMIVSGYLGRMFARNYPLSVSISITFEQSYDGIDGDSASSTELYAVLSSLAEIPLRQEIAVTGSVNQKGEIQAIGGVNEKIEGFYDICVKRGLTNTQGVMIPASNVKHLVLRKDVVQAMERGEFHLYKISTIEQGIEVLTGVRAGEPDENGTYPGDTLFGRVAEKLKRFHELSTKSSRP
ncbi:MAG: ATP-binding protein [Desulfobacterium sp.]|nr:ATP-binding protein [Desulfobacterium sp.]